jgi:hypothetical protein
MHVVDLRVGKDPVDDWNDLPPLANFGVDDESESVIPSN